MGNCLKFTQGTAEPIFMNDEDDINTNPQHVAMGQNQPLIHDPLEWVSDVPLTEGQLRGKRDTFWETAPVYDGRREIWDALKVACEASETGDYDLAQAIITGAGISLPKGRLTEAYDELGNRYTLPPYCSSRPSNMQSEEATPLTPSATSGSQDQVTLKIRLSTNSKDFKCTVSKGDSVGMLKERIQSLHNVEPAKMKMFLSGRLVQDNVLVGDLDIPKGFVIQMIVT